MRTAGWSLPAPDLVKIKKERLDFLDTLFF
jgi:hypothetical protein